MANQVLVGTALIVTAFGMMTNGSARTGKGERTMPDREKVIGNLTSLRERLKWQKDIQGYGVYISFVDDAIDLLKEKEAETATLEIDYIVPYGFSPDEKEIKNDLAIKIAQKLIEDGYVEFSCNTEDIELSEDETIVDVEIIKARLDVVRPSQKGR